MSTTRISKRIVLISVLLAASATALADGTSLAAVKQLKPHVSTGAAQHVLTTSAQLTAVITPNGKETSYYFQWGPTTAYGSQTPTVSVGAGTAKVKVGQAISKLAQGATYHFRVVAVYSGGQPVIGRDRSFVTKGSVLKFEIPKIPDITVGTPFVLSGALTGLGAPNRAVVLQASPYPYQQAFTTITAPGLTNAAGRFSFRVASLATSTAFRLVTLDPRPLYSSIVTVHAAVRVTLHVRSSGHTGLVRVYGTVTPAAVGAPLLIQLRKAIQPRPTSKPSESEATTHFVAQFTTMVKKGGRSFSRFSMVISPRHTGRYRAYVKLHTGALVSGASATVVLHAAPGSGSKRKKKG
jgi:hypothetical protein